ncbi:N-carbamoyl-L-amino-acid hydrolase [Lentibacillus halodurans]|uniref:N-carbamoyl-L-amino-acid hydrolase n=1 Tax=Lentibacillus halodurans TaxID=237679 RepID=A0A1I0YDH5_9BACI|nr:M20 family metallo-hydrolase [Lentibacillus halodurans]SFB10570.1 N-carbamoyl-L-amino-acid hydrolase [Lentibacillus halodurans]
MTELREWLEDTFYALNLTDKENIHKGFSRLGYTKEEAAAHNQFLKIADGLGLNTYRDEIGNQWAVWEVDKSKKTIAMGSHLDTVYNGGGYDGVAGILCALASIKMLMDKKVKPNRNVAIICFASEESARFGISTIGSKGITGQLDKDKIADIGDKDEMTIKQAIEEFGLSWNDIENAELPTDKIESFLELHIEQGNILQEKHADIGIVNGVARPIRFVVKVRGQANHTGTTPMNKRRDALVEAAPLISFINNEAQKVYESSSLVATVSTLKLTPNAMNIIPGEVELGIDIRSVKDQVKHDFAAKFKAFCSETEKENNVTIDIHTLVDDQSITLDNKLQNKLLKAAQKEGLKTLKMDSGAGHDVMNMAQKWPSGLIFIPCKDGISHHPEEYTSLDHLVKGSQVLQRFLEEELNHNPIK